MVTELEASGIDHSNISIVANQDAPGRHTTTTGTTTRSVTGGGTSSLDPAQPDDFRYRCRYAARGVAGTLLGGGAGLLAGLGALAIPGIGPIVAAGWLVATLTGAAVGAAGGGLIGALTGAGISHEEATVYNEGVQHGGTLVTVRIEDADASRAEAIMQQRNPVDWRTRTADVGGTGTTSSTNAQTIETDVPGGLGTRLPPGNRTI